MSEEEIKLQVQKEITQFHKDLNKTYKQELKRVHNVNDRLLDIIQKM